MNLTEEYMKERGENKVFNSIKSKNGNYKKIAATQIGQQIIFDEALRIFPMVKSWIQKGSGKNYRKELLEFFSSDEILLGKITETLLCIAGTIYVTEGQKESPSRHKRVQTLRAKVLEGLSFENAWRFLEVTIDLSDYFAIEKLIVGKVGSWNWKFTYTSTLSEEILAKLAMDAAMAFYPLPMLEPPLDWSFDGYEIKGGYKTFQYDMVRAKIPVDYSKFSQKIFESVNYIQSVPWKVNEHVMEQLRQDLKMPVKRDFVKSDYPKDDFCNWELDLDEKGPQMDKNEVQKILDARQSFRESVELYRAEVGDFESAMGKYRAVDLALRIAERFKGQTLYFPHNYDFRGRVYPIPIGLSPQGSDAVKSLLEYKEGEVLTKEGEKWAWAYLASLWGDDKMDFEDRVERGKELIGADYKEADEPYQFLAHQIELNKLLSDPDYKFNGRVHLDACNSGSQFTSAITGDKAGCEATNVIPTINPDGSQTRQDAYILVAHKAQDLTKSMIKKSDDESQGSVLRFLKSLLDNHGRKICKRPVMVSNYGGTTGGRTDILWDMFRELRCERKWINRKNAALFSRIIGESISGVLNGGKAFEGYIQKMNTLIAKANKPVMWTTDDGFHVTHVKSKELKSKRITLTLPDARRPTTIIKKEYSKDVSAVKMKSAIAPNYIHSLDAELLRRTALKMKRQGIKDSDWIHDSFGCHPNYVDKMLYLTKSEFSKLARRRPLSKLDKELRGQVKPTKANLKKLDDIKLPHLRGFNANNGDLDVVFESDWFFS